MPCLNRSTKNRYKHRNKEKLAEASTIEINLPHFVYKNVMVQKKKKKKHAASNI